MEYGADTLTSITEKNGQQRKINQTNHSPKINEHNMKEVETKYSILRNLFSVLPRGDNLQKLKLKLICSYDEHSQECLRQLSQSRRRMNC